MVVLTARFLQFALAPLNFFLRLTGVHLCINYSTWKSRLIRSWGISLFVLCVQSNVYITIKRTELLNDFFSFLPSDEGFARKLTSALFRLSALVSDVLIHFVLIFNIWPRIESFLEFLESVDCDLKRPNLSLVQRISFIGLIYTLCTVSHRTDKHFIIIGQLSCIYFRFIPFYVLLHFFVH